ncbi:MAG: dihydropteroate synthase [Fibrobacterota bacterium]|jgi:dihydropteroate synthase
MLVGIVNVTPDSFFDGGRHASTAQAIAHGLRLWEEGAHQLDVGGESTRPGALPVSLAQELERVVPVVQALTLEGCCIAVDTRHIAVARACLEVGAHAVNDIEGLRNPAMIALCKEFQAGACAMHMQGTPQDMQQAPVYTDVEAEVGQFLSNILDRWVAAGLSPQALALDPGIGFGKSVDHNYRLLKATARLRRRFPLCPWYLGLSRKSFVGRTPGVSPGSDRLAGSLAAALAAASAGADILRVHDVAATREALLVHQACQEELP